MIDASGFLSPNYPPDVFCSIRFSQYEFDRRVLEVLREPLESGHITISRAARQIDFPARFQLVAAMNPCPCGWLGDPSGKCRCSPEQVQRYRSRVSGPLLDRIDLQLFVHRVDHQALTREQPLGESSAAVRQRVIAARTRQLQRQQQLNTELSGTALDRHCQPDGAAEAMLLQAAARLSLSARGYHRVLRVARTIADLEGLDAIGAGQVAEALRYRGFDRDA